jgi:sugar lactone lactonase YvrE
VQEAASGSQRVLVSGAVPNEGGALWDLSGIAADSAGNVYFSEPSLDRVYVLPPPYTGVPQIIASGVDTPEGLAVDANGDLFIADYGNNRVVEVPAGGSQQTLFSMARPIELAVDASGTLYVTSSTLQTLDKYAAPYTGAPTLVASNRQFGGLATTQPATPVTDIQNFTLTGTVISAPVGGTPTGTVMFKEGATTIGTATLTGSNPATATLNVNGGTLGIGSHAITAFYNGNGLFPGSTSGVATVNVISSVLHVSVTGSQASGGSNLHFVDARPTAPSGVAFAGALSGCQTSVAANAAIGAYASTISNCGGLSLTGANHANYTIAYDDGGFTVTKPQVTVDVTGTLPYQGTARYAGSLVAPPTGVTGLEGTLTCTTSVSNTAAFATYQGTITNCQGVHLTGPNAGNYDINFVDAGLTVGRGEVNVTVNGSRVYLGATSFTSTNPASLPSGITGITGSLASCTASLSSTTDIGTYQHTISGCSGLSLTGTATSLWMVVYVDGGVTITPTALPVTVTGNQPYNNVPTYSFAQPSPLPAGVTGVSGVVSGCTTTLSRTAAIGFYPAPIINTSGCGGLTVAGTNAPDYVVTYVDGGVNVFPGPTGTSLSVSPAPDPDIYVSEQGNYDTPTLNKLSSPYTSRTNVALNNGYYYLTPTATAVASNGDRFVVDQGFGVDRITPDGTTSRVYSRQSLGDVAVDQQGNLFIADNPDGQILELAPPYTATPTVIASGQSFPKGIAADSAGDVFFSTSDSHIKVLTQPYTSAPAVVQTLSDGLHATSLAVDAAGTLYWDTNYQGGSGQVYVRKVAPPYTGTPVDVIGTATPKSPNGLAVDASGNVYFADNTYATLDGNTGKLWKVSGATATSYNVGLQPTGVAVSQPPSQVIQGASVTFTATVISSPPGNAPAGSVEFYEGSTLLGSGALTGTTPDTATFSTSALPPGTHTVTARYVGNATYPTSISGPSTVVVYGPTVSVPVSATQTFGGTPTFMNTLPSLPPGVSVTGTMSGCTTSVTSATHVGTYMGTISGCAGLDLTGPNSGSFTLVYSDVGVIVSPASVSVGVTGTQPYRGTPTFTADVGSLTLPDGVNAVDGDLTGCVTNKTALTVVGHYSSTISGCGGLSLLGPNGGDYLVHYVDNGFTVTRVMLTVGVAGSRLFGGTAGFWGTFPTLPPNVFFGGVLFYCTTSVGSSDPVGTYANTISGCGNLFLTGAEANQYGIAFADLGFTVSPADLTVQLNATQVYGHAPTYTALPFGSLPYGIDGYTGFASCTTTEPASAPVGTYYGVSDGCTGIVPTGPLSADYAVNIYFAGEYDVTPATLTVTPDPQSIHIGDPDPTFSFGITGYQNNEDASVISVQPTCGVVGAHSAEGDYTISCTGGSAPNYAFDTTATSTLSVGRTAQAISFAPLADQRFDTGSFTLSASASSGLPVSFSTGSTACSVSGTTVTLLSGANDMCTIDADQAGDSSWKPATRVSRSFTITPGEQTITFGSLVDKQLDQGPITLSASASSGLPVSFSTASTACSVTGTSVTFNAPGTCTIDADQPGNSSWNAAPQVPQTFTITKKAQTITFAALADRRFDAGSFTLSGSASSGLPVSFSTGSTACSVSGTTVTLLSGANDTCTIDADQPGDSSWAAAGRVSHSFTVTPGNQTITFGPLADKRFDQGPITVSATASSGLPVSFSSGSPTVCSVLGTSVSFITTTNATCTVNADQGGNAEWNAALRVSQGFTITTQASQSITFGTLTDKLFGTVPFTVAATASSGLPVSFASLTPAACGVTGTSVTLLGPGQCTVQATQAGNASFLAAPPVSRSFNVTFTKACTTGHVKDPVVVKVGQAICLDSASLDKDVNVQKGGSVWINHSTIKGGVNGAGAIAVTICNTTISGPLKLTDGTGPVIVGGAFCGNTINGPVTIQRNVRGVTYSFNVAGTTVTITDNKGGFIYASDTAKGKVNVKNNT